MCRPKPLLLVSLLCHLSASTIYRIAGKEYEQRAPEVFCIPAYNRAKFLGPLLDSIFVQDYKDFNIVICEDQSREREEIATIVQGYADRFPGVLHYYENET